MLLYMIRHGESTANPMLRHAGWAQVPLTAKGEQDAQVARETLKGIEFDAVYSSDLVRALQTKEIALPGVAFEVTPLLREINVGELAGKLPDEATAIYGEKYLADKARADFRDYGGENREDHQARAVAFLRLLEKSPVSRVAAFCHEGTMRRTLEFVQGANAPIKRHCKNGGVCIFEHKEGTWHLVHWEDR